VIDSKKLADKQLELAAEFAQYLADHPEMDRLLPAKSHICFQIEGDPEFNRYSHELAKPSRREPGVPVVIVRIKGLAPPPGSRLIDPVIESQSAVA
jgi:hypothetical protein